MAIVSKGDLVNGMFQLIRISGLTVQANPEEKEIALQVADDYAAELKPFLDIGWAYPSDYGLSDPADNSGLAIEMAGPFKKLLALQVVEFFGKQPTQILVKIASDGMRTLEQLLVNVPDAQNPPTLPFGSGNEWDYRDRKFYNEPADNHGASYVFKGDILNYDEDFSQWVGDEALDSAVWEVQDSGLSIANESFTDSVASAQLTFDKTGGFTVCITVTKTNSTDKLTVRKNFIIEDCQPSGLRFN